MNSLKLFACIAIVTISPFSVSYAQVTSKLLPTFSSKGALVLEGYGPYRLGMTYKQASMLNPKAVKTKCGYLGTSFCLTYKEKILKDTANVNVLFGEKSNLIYKVNLTFDLLDFDKYYKSGKCGDLRKDLVEHFRTYWGKPSRGELSLQNEREMCWVDQQGRRVCFWSGCVANETDLGLLVVSITSPQNK